MIVPDNIRKCVVFLGYRMADGSMRFAGPAFFLGRDQEGEIVKDVYLVTAKHVIDGIRKPGLAEFFVRANTSDGQSVWAKCQSADWHFHPNDRVLHLQTPQMMKENSGAARGCQRSIFFWEL